MTRFALPLAMALGITLSCGGSDESDGTGGSAGSGGSSGSAGQTGDSGSPCPVDQCLGEAGACVEATGPVGNGLCPGLNGECTPCKCAAPDTPIATPNGESRIADLRVGDVVYSVDHGAVRAVPIAAVRKTPVKNHRVTRVRLASGVTLEISPVHPTADGRTFGDLRAGGELGGVRMIDAEIVPYVGAFTHDILPASDTGTYFAGGALIGSTLAVGASF